MDTLSHALWAMAIFWHTPLRYWAFLFGALPDLLTFGPRFVLRFLDYIIPGELPQHGQFIPYNISHSFVVWLAVALLFFLFTRRKPYLVIACFIHITQDAFTHVGNWATPILWPVSDLTYQYGIRWRTPEFMIINIVALGIVYTLIAVHEAQRKRR